MILVIAFTAAAVALAVVAPVALTRIDFTTAPAAGIAAWLGATAALIGCAVSAMLALAWPSHAPGEGAADTLLRCLSTVEHLVPSWVGWVAVPVATSALIVGGLRLARTAAGHRERGLAVRRRHNELIAVLGRIDPGSARLVWLDHPVPLAYSVAGRDGYVVATAGLALCLTEDERRAVLAHEHAHLRGFHHHILGASQVLAAAFPRVPLLTAAPGALACLVELAADRAAAASSGSEALYTALHTVAASAATRPETASATQLALIDESLSVRLDRLSAPAASAGTTSRAAAAMIVVTAVLAMIASMVVVGISAAAACLSLA